MKAKDIDKKSKVGFAGDVKVRVSVELGGKDMKLKDIVGLKAGKIVELDSIAGSPFIVKANGKSIARGEIVTVADYYGVRIVDILK